MEETKLGVARGSQELRVDIKPHRIDQSMNL